MAGVWDQLNDRMLGYLVPPSLAARARAKWTHWRKRNQGGMPVELLDQFFAHHWRGDRPERNYFLTFSSQHFFFDPGSRSEYVAAFRQLFPGREAEILTRSREAVSGTFRIFGHTLTSPNYFPDWHADFIAGTVWSKKLWPQIHLLSPDDTSDVKVPWELSRLQWLSFLGRAYWLTGDEQYAARVVATVEHWESANPVGVGVNWTCSMEVAIRAINIIWGLQFIADSTALTHERIGALIRLLYYHGRHIEDNLEVIERGANTNHLLSDYLGLWYLGLLFPEFDRAGDWGRIAQRGLEEEIVLQVLPDGFDYEGSTAYHRLVLEIFLSAAILGRRNGQEFSPQYYERLRGMVAFSAAVVPPSGRVPLLGDNDDGLVIELSDNDPSNHQNLVELGRVFLSEESVRPQFEDGLWYLGPKSCPEQTDSESAPKSRLFSQSGIGVLRHENIFCLVSAVAVPKGSLGGHRHNDLLSIVLELGGQPILVDAGTSCYTSDLTMREQARSVGAHNTVQVGNTEQQRILAGRPFLLVGDAAAGLTLEESESVIRLAGFHTGYGRLPEQVIHRREVTLKKQSRELVIRDRLEGKEGSVVAWAVRYLTPIMATQQTSADTVEVAADPNVVVRFSFTSADGTLAVRESRWWPRFRQERAAMQIELSGKGSLPVEIQTTIQLTKKAASSLAPSVPAGLENKRDSAP